MLGVRVSVAPVVCVLALAAAHLDENPTHPNLNNHAAEALRALAYGASALTSPAPAPGRREGAS